MFCYFITKSVKEFDLFLVLKLNYFLRLKTKLLMTQDSLSITTEMYL